MFVAVFFLEDTFSFLSFEFLLFYLEVIILLYKYHVAAFQGAENMLVFSTPDLTRDYSY